MRLRIGRSLPYERGQAICSTGSGRFVALTKGSLSGRCASCWEQEASGKVRDGRLLVPLYMGCY